MPKVKDLEHKVADTVSGNSALEAEVSSGGKFSTAGVYVSIALSVVLAALMLADLSRGAIGVLVIGLTISLLLGGVPIGIGLSASSILGLYAISGTGATGSAVQELLYGTTASWSLSVIPLFIFMGIALWKSGVTTKAFEAARQWLGILPGGLAIATNFSGAGLAAASGSSLGISHALGRIAIPEMLKAGYKPSLATGVVAVAGTLGQLIPPSILLVVYASVAQTSIGPQLIASIVPAAILATLYAIMIYVRALLSPQLAPKADTRDVTLKTRINSLWGVVPLAIVVLVVVGGMAFGLFTPTEAGAFGAVTALAVGIVYTLMEKSTRSVTHLGRFIGQSLLDTTKSATSIFLMLIGVYLLTRVLTLSRITNDFTAFILGIDIPTWAFLVILVFVFLILGMFLEPVAMILLTVPILYEPLMTMGVDMIWFGIFIVFISEIGQVSPPIGLLSFVVHTLSKDPEVNMGHKISLVDVFKGVLWFVAVAVLFSFVLIWIPELATWLPSVTGV